VVPLALEKQVEGAFVADWAEPPHVGDMSVLWLVSKATLEADLVLGRPDRFEGPRALI
jgi:hypothetical protein